MRTLNDVCAPINRQWLGIYDMCAFGTLHMVDMGADQLRFECFNEDEANEVKACMERHFPKVKFYCTWLKSRPQEGDGGKA